VKVGSKLYKLLSRRPISCFFKQSHSICNVIWLFLNYQEKHNGTIRRRRIFFFRKMIKIKQRKNIHENIYKKNTMNKRGTLVVK